MRKTIARGQKNVMQAAVTLGSEPGASMAPGSQAEAASSPAVEISHLRKTYGPLVAVDDVSFSVAEGEIFGILGPNGAGKTTTVECAIGLRSPDSGTIRLMGIDPHADKAQIHEITGVQLQSGAFPAKLRVGEIIDMYQSFYRRPADVANWPGRSAWTISASPTTDPCPAASSSACPWYWRSSARPRSQSWTK
jgi:ABC-type glutathione transport system ATPase component